MARVLASTEDVPVLASFLEQRRRAGQDLYDEVWEGVYRIVPVPPARHGQAQARLLASLQQPPTMEHLLVEEGMGLGGPAGGLVATGPVNIGTADDYRIPDVAVIAADHLRSLYVPTAACVVEILSSTETAGIKLPFYRRHGVGLYVEVDLDAGTVEAMVPSSGESRRDTAAALVAVLFGR